MGHYFQHLGLPADPEVKNLPSSAGGHMGLILGLGELLRSHMPQGNKACVQQPNSLQAATRDIHILQMKTQLSQKERKERKKSTF